RPPQLPCQHVGDVDLDDDLAVEVVTGVQIKVGVSVSRKAVDTAVTAAPVGVDGPVERESGSAGYPVQRRPSQDLVESDARELRCAYRPHQILQSVQPRYRRRISDRLPGNLLAGPPHSPI